MDNPHPPYPVEPAMSKTKTPFSWQDPFALHDQLSADERAVQDAAHAYCQDKLLPRVQQAKAAGGNRIEAVR